MATRRDILRRLRRRERRLRLIGLSAATAVLCGAIVAVLMPEVLIGGQRKTAPTVGAPAAAPAERPAGPLRLSEHLQLETDQVRENARRWTRMPERERGRFYAAYWRLADLDEAQRAELFDRHRAFRSQPARRQEDLRKRARELQHFIDTELGPQDQAILNRMPPEKRAERILELWRARRGG